MAHIKRNILFISAQLYERKLIFGLWTPSPDANGCIVEVKKGKPDF